MKLLLAYKTNMVMKLTLLLNHQSVETRGHDCYAKKLSVCIDRYIILIRIFLCGISDNSDKRYTNTVPESPLNDRH